MLSGGFAAVRYSVMALTAAVAATLTSSKTMMGMMYSLVVVYISYTNLNDISLMQRFIEGDEISMKNWTPYA